MDDQLIGNQLVIERRGEMEPFVRVCTDKMDCPGCGREISEKEYLIRLDDGNLGGL